MVNHLYSIHYVLVCRMELWKDHWKVLASLVIGFSIILLYITSNFIFSSLFVKACLLLCVLSVT
uniref:Putative ovule protein n=1 Tax=Solanum chacoense TaxID=4108 RepID=A0A0V0HPI4_SOLCH